MHMPRNPIGPLPAVVMVPGGRGHGGQFCTGAAPIWADDLAASGLVAVHYDPPGRGMSTGVDDFCGPLHRKALAAVIMTTAVNHAVDEGALGVAAFSLGMCTAAPTLAEWPELPVRFLLDWESPHLRGYIFPSDVGLEGHGLHIMQMHDFWEEREPLQHIGRVRCGYYRFQSRIDHVHGRDLSAAVAMVNAAVDGAPAWARLNRNPPGVRYTLSTIAKAELEPPGLLRQSSRLRRALVDLAFGRLER